jgi:hypothetical protein
MRKILRTILSQAGFAAPSDSNMEMWEESELINALQKFLLDRRYASMKIIVLLVIYGVEV